MRTLLTILIVGTILVICSPALLGTSLIALPAVLMAAVVAVPVTAVGLVVGAVGFGIPMLVLLLVGAIVLLLVPFIIVVSILGALF